MRAGPLLLAAALLVGLAAGPAHGSAQRGSRTAKRTPVAKTPAKQKASTTTGKSKTAATVGGTRKTTARTPARTRTAAATTPEPLAEKRLTRDQRFASARAGALKSMKPFAGGGLDIEAVLAREQIQLTPGASKFLGRGPVRVIIRPKVTARTSRWERWTKAFRPDHNRRVLMSVSETGIPSVMEEEPDAIQHRLWRGLNAIIPIGEITRDVLSSDKAKAGLVGGVSSLFTATINPAVAVGFGLVALRYIGKGVQERRAARKTALDRTAEYIRAKEQAGETPAVSVAYRFYEGEMEEAGSRAISKDAFIEQMSYRLGKPVKLETAPAATPTPAPAVAAAGTTAAN